MERKAHGRVDRVAPYAVIGVEFMEPPGVEIDLLRAHLEGIGDDRPDRRDMPLERAIDVAGAAVIGQLLVEIAADPDGKPKGQVLRERPFDMEFGAALVIRRSVDGVDVDAERGGRFEPGLRG